MNYYSWTDIWYQQLPNSKTTIIITKELELA